MLKEFFLNKLKERFPENLFKYNYSLLPNKFKAVDKIKIICKKHDIFEQTVNNHLFGKGCNKCGIISSANAKKYTTAEFIKKAIRVHGYNYDYSKVDINNSDGNVIIECKKHGLFSQKLNKHLYGQGCPVCGRENIGNKLRSDKEYFINKANKIHSFKYNYNKVTYTRAIDKITITCPIHGDFEQTPNSHLNGAGCNICGGSVKSDTSDFINKSKLMHNEKYTYDKVNYINNKTKILITCPIHGDFEQTPSEHLNGCGCPKCKCLKLSLDRRSNNEDFIVKAKLIHGDSYNYDKVNYVNRNTKIIINCKKHGDFLQVPGSHISGNGCPICKESSGEKYITQILNKFNIKYIREYRLLPHRYMYDFYLSDYNIYIEYNGIQHYKPVDCFGGSKQFKKTIKNDKIKKELVKRSTGLLIVLKHTLDSISKIEYELLRLFSVLHPQFFTNIELTKQAIADSNIFLINNGIAYTRNYNKSLYLERDGTYT